MIEYWLWASKENKNDKTLDLRSFRFCLTVSILSESHQDPSMTEKKIFKKNSTLY